jgi:hypothetical protein
MGLDWRWLDKRIAYARRFSNLRLPGSTAGGLDCPDHACSDYRNPQLLCGGMVRAKKMIRAAHAKEKQ